MRANAILKHILTSHSRHKLSYYKILIILGMFKALLRGLQFEAFQQRGKFGLPFWHVSPKMLACFALKPLQQTKQPRAGTSNSQMSK